MQSKIIEKINRLLEEKEFVLVAIDGRCGAGKTTLAENIKKELSCNVIHLDSFFLRPEQRTKERLETTGGNMDRERFLEEAAVNLKENKAFSYRPFNCHTLSFDEAVEIRPHRVTIVEGTYSCHPELFDIFDLHIFLDVDKEEQMRRIIRRNGADGAKVFEEKWIPLEEKYFKEYNIKEKSTSL